ncbi:tigger transposable element-derived protein 1-like [Palaemon carinicauda]|uniref:tigger transposable element-derived protein 1-like n=1 Tax=Palaemon carinicauda TaxID=392227 RepID=UPI0035B65021
MKKWKKTKKTPDDPQPGPSSRSTKKKAQFVTSKGWFAKFQKRYGLKSVAMLSKAASWDKVAAKEYVRDMFQDIMNEGEYLPEQVFNIDKTGLFWKRMPLRTFLFKMEASDSGFKAYKDRVTLAICGNAPGYMLKPALFDKYQNQRALKFKNNIAFPPIG